MDKLEIQYEFVNTGVDLENRKLFLSGVVDHLSVDPIIRGLHILSKMNKDPITLFINSPGGDIYVGLGLYDCINEVQNSGIEITTVGIGSICSIALPIFLAGSIRTCTENTRFMYHKGKSVLPEEGDRYTLKSDLQETEIVEELADGIVSAKTKKKRKWWNQQIEKSDFWFGKEEALKYGVITE